MSEPKEAPRVKVKLTVSTHQHRGEPCAKDAIIEVTQAQAKRLIEQKRAIAV